MPATEPGNPQDCPIDEDWYASAFGDLYPVLYAHRTVEAATEESAFAIRQLDLCNTCSVLDLCCGNGRHMVHLLRHTPHVFGLDYSPDLLGFARVLLKGRGALLRGDMRAIPFEASLDAVANFFTSFGYFTDERENVAVARGIARALKPGGRFFIDYLNPEYLAGHLEPESTRIAGEFGVLERRWIDRETNRVNKATEVRRAGQLVSRSSESVRLYGEIELIALLNDAGLEVEATYGGYDGTGVAADKPRLIAVGARR